MIEIKPGLRFKSEGRSGKVLYQLTRFVGPGKRDVPQEEYRVEIEGSPIQYMSTRQIQEALRDE